MKNTMGRIARAAAAAGLSLALALGGVAPNMAMAAVGDGSGSVTITSAQDNTVEEYTAIKIFTADVTNEGTDASPKCVAEDLSWGSDAAKTAVEAAIRSYCSDNNLTYAGTTAQNAADFIIEHINGSDYTTIVSSSSFANTLANYLATAAIDGTVDGTALSGGRLASTAITPGTKTNLQEGYYLVIANPTKLSTGSSSTSPILILLAEGQNLAITEKTSVPTLDKSVTEDKDGKNYDHADAQVGQELPFTLTGTVAGNINNFSTYYYQFTDTLSKGLDLKVSGGTRPTIDPGDVVVTVDNTASTEHNQTTYTLSSGYDVTYVTNTDNTRTLTVTFNDLRTNTGTSGTDQTPVTVPIDAASVVRVAYKASLNSDAEVGTTTGNPNTATLTYNTTPNRPETGTTTSTSSNVYTYALSLKKVDKSAELDGDTSTNVPLAGAVFTIQAKTTDETTTHDDCYLKNDGTFGETTLPESTTEAYKSYLFTTNSDGILTAKGLDAGTYTIHEVTAPTGYDTISADLTLAITATKNADNSVKSVKATLSGGEGDADTDLTKGTRASFDDATGTVNMIVTDPKKEELPLTGLSGITLVYVAGGAILAVSLVAIVRRRMKDQG